MPKGNTEGSARVEYAGIEFRAADLPQYELRELCQMRRAITDEVAAVEFTDDLSDEDLTRVERMMRHGQMIEIQIERAQEEQRHRPLPDRPVPPLGHGLNPFGGSQFPGDVPPQFRNAPQPEAETRGVLLRTVNGREVRALPRGVPFAQPAAGRNGAAWEDRTGDLCVGRAIVGMVTGDWSGAEREHRSMITSNGAAGGYLLNPTLSGSVIDLARNASSVMQAGALTVPMDSSELRIAKVLSDPVAHWRHEGQLIPASDMSFELLTLRARAVAAFVPITVEMLEDASNASSLIRNALQAALGLELDRAALRGQGGDAEPVGLRYADGVNETGSVGSPTYDDIIDAVTDIKSANGMPNAWLLSPREEGTISKLKDSQLQYLQPPPAVSALTRITSNQIPTDLGGGAESEMYVGDFRQLLVGMRTGVQIEVFTSGMFVDSNGNSVSSEQNMKAAIRAYLRADVALIRPTHFTRLLGVTA